MKARAALVPLLLAATACGETYDLADRTTTVPTVTVPVTEPPVAVPAEAGALLTAMVEAWAGLDQRVIDRDGAEETLAEILDLWARAEPILRRERPGLLFGIGQAVDLARSAVASTRPADASKGYGLMLRLLSSPGA